MRAVKITLTLLGAGMLGALLGLILAYLLGVWMARTYVPHGPNDPRDAPVYVTMGLMMIAAPVGGVIAIGLTGLRLLRRARAATEPRAA